MSSVSGVLQKVPFIKLSDVKASGVASGTFTSGAWQTRTLNTEDHDTGNNCSLASNQFTLDPGTYEVFAIGRATKAGHHKLKIRNVTDATDEVIGISSYCEPSTAGSNIATLSGRFTIGAAKTFELQHRCGTTRATNGFGEQNTFGVSEVYAVVELRKVA